MSELPKVFIIMGVSGCGKSTVGQALAAALRCPFYDGDDFHPPPNVAKMASGTPLTDADRAPWLAALHDLLLAHVERGETAVLACSALKKKYRRQLRQGNDSAVFIYLQGEFDLIWRRMRAREDHFMRAGMLRSQFEALEPPAPAEALVISIDQTVAEIVSQIQKQING